MPKISQREARRTWKRLAALEQQLELQRRVWGQEYFGGVEIARTSWSSDARIPVAIRTARNLNHAVVCIGHDDGTVRFMALPHPKVSA
jgi:C1A family cysteine protease